ncbi:MAG: transglycosylase SLT domain-containing protein [Syntrophobacteraceae bacterium]|nr:transglycosylase SLT domain-containing protein [Syntrophobacteraceae bacterium]
MTDPTSQILRQGALLFFLALLLSGCGSLDSCSPYQPARVVILQGFTRGKPADFKKIKQGLETALKAEKAGKTEAFLQGMKKARADAAKFLSSSAEYKVSDKTTYQFLADRLADAPAYPEPMNAEMLMKLESCASSKSCGQKAWDETVCRGKFDANALLDPEAIEKGLDLMLADWGETSFAVDGELVRHVGYFLKYFALCDTDRTNRVIERSRKYLPYIQEVFVKNNLNEDIAFAVPFVESGFTTSALSNAGALGMFQFMPATGKDYGLNVGANGADERLDWKKTAEAAARYLDRNRNVFGSSVLALGSYHHGSLKVMQVLMRVAQRSKVRSFRPIFERGELEPYSKEYIPQCLAAAYLYRYMKQAHLSCLPKEDVRYVAIRQNVAVKKLAGRYKDLLAANKDLTNADRIYCYVSTGGYALITEAKGCGLRAGGVRAALDRKRVKAVKAAAPAKVCGAKYCAAEPVEEKHDKSCGSAAAMAKEGRKSFCTVMYTFQKGNSLALLAKTFGVDLHSILDEPLNSRYKERYPRQPSPGDIIAIPRLAPTTAIVSSGKSGAGPGYSFYTGKNQTLTEIASKLSETFSSSEAQKSDAGLSGKNISAERILYWNRDRLPPGVGVGDPLPAGIALFIVSDFR